ncbi:MAG TPA: hypothetical protein VHE54_03640 [Puia sp.]|nr:hypothetical protein [Puia sp.]
MTVGASATPGKAIAYRTRLLQIRVMQKSVPPGSGIDWPTAFTPSHSRRFQARYGENAQRNGSMV